MPGRNKSVILFLIVMLLSCTPNLYRPVQEDVALAQSLGLNVDLKSLEKGRKMYIETCAGCHYLHYPQEYRNVQWDTIIPSMQRRSEGKIPDSTAGRILQYLYVASKHTGQASNSH